MKPVSFDVSDISVSSDGVVGFFWPLQRSEVVAVRDHFVGAATEFSRSEMRRNPSADIFGTVLLAAYLGELLTLFQAQAITHRSRRCGFEPTFPTNSRVMGPLARGEQPIQSGSLRLLRAGSRTPGPFFGVLRDLKDRFSGPVIARRRLKAVDLASDIVTVAYGDMILQHAAAIPQRVCFVRFEEWFSPIRGEDSSKNVGNSALVTALMEISAAAFAAGGEKLERDVADYLQRWLSQALHAASMHVERILQKPHAIPSQLWRGTGGHLFSRILSYATQKAGGLVVGHDHAMGHGIFDSFSHTIVEHPACDRFLVWTAVQQQMALRCIRVDLLMRERSPIIDVVPGIFKPTVPARRSIQREPQARPQRIMYVGSLYGETVHATPLIPDVVLVDWEARLIARLLAWGYEVMVKPHPESRVQSGRALSALGAQLIDGRFEEVYQKADVVIFGQMNASSFYGLLSTDHPFVVADTGLHRLQPEAFEMLQRRCGYVRCLQDENNRLQLDWDVLKSAIEEAPSLRDAGLYRTYFQPEQRDVSGDDANR